MSLWLCICMMFEIYLSLILMMFFFFFFKQKTAYEMRISDWSSDVCSSDLANYTFTKSKRGQIYNWPYGAPGEEVYEFSGISFNNQPKHSGTVALTYNKYGIDATLAYGFQSRTLDNFYPRGLSVYRDRKRCVEGQRVSEIVKFGGARN